MHENFGTPEIAEHGKLDIQAALFELQELRIFRSGNGSCGIAHEIILAAQQCDNVDNVLGCPHGTKARQRLARIVSSLERTGLLDHMEARILRQSIESTEIHTRSLDAHAESLGMFLEGGNESSFVRKSIRELGIPVTIDQIHSTPVTELIDSVRQTHERTVQPIGLVLDRCIQILESALHNEAH